MPRKIKLPRKVKFVLVDSVTLKHTGGRDEWGNPTDDSVYQLDKIRIDRQGIRSVSTQGDSVTHLDIFMIYPDYVTVTDGDGKTIDCPDLSTMNSDDKWMVVDGAVNRSVSNVNVIKQPFSNEVFCYELEVV